MLFNSYIYFVFLAIVYLLYRSLSHRKQNLLLLTASYVFYGFWSVKFCSLLLISTVVDFYCGRALARTENERNRTLLITLSVVTNLGILGVFKYYDFFVSSMVELLAVFGLDASPRLLHVVLPVGISFYTFQTMTYSIDIYRRQLRPTHDIFDFALFVSFFPQLVAGPIERASHLLPQLVRERILGSKMTREGLWLILVGLFKKAVVADNLALIADNVFNAPGEQTGLYVLLGVYAFTFQIYCDFSGYTDIARGTARLFGVDLMLNFRQPYFATNPREFWRRWHISLSTWLRDYLYISLGGNRKNRTYRNLMITMLLGGLWHGAAMTFVTWGAYQGVMLVIHRRFERVWEGIGSLFGGAQRTWLALRVFVFFHITCLGWILFRAERLADVKTLLVNLFRFGPVQSPQVNDALLFVFLVIPILVLDGIRERRGGAGWIFESPFWVRVNAVVYLVFMLAFWASHENIPFIYFQF